MANANDKSTNPEEQPRQVYSDPDAHRSGSDRTLHVEDVMTRDVAVVNPHTTIEEAAEKMRLCDVGPLPVCDRDQLVGMITDRDILQRSVAKGEDPTQDRVRFVSEVRSQIHSGGPPRINGIVVSL